MNRRDAASATRKPAKPLAETYRIKKRRRDPGLAFRGRLRKTRKSKGLTQSSLAALASLSRASVAKMELGHQEPTLRALVRLSDALLTTSDFLLGRSRESGPVIVRVIPIPEQEYIDAVEKIVEIKEAPKERFVPEPKPWSPG